MRPCWIQTTELIVPLAREKTTDNESAIELRPSDGGSTMLVILIRTGGDPSRGKTIILSGIHFQRFLSANEDRFSEMVSKRISCN